MMKRVLALAAVLLSTTFLSAQAPVAVDDVVRMSGGVELSTGENVKISADRVELNRKTGEMLLFGTVIVRQNLRPAIQPVAATNSAGVPFPDPQQVTMRVRGTFNISVGDVTLHADEADINGLTGEMTLRGNVKASSSRWAAKINIQ